MIPTYDFILIEITKNQSVSLLETCQLHMFLTYVTKKVAVKKILNNQLKLGIEVSILEFNLTVEMN